MVGQGMDVVSPVAQDTRVSIDETNLGLGGDDTFASTNINFSPAESIVVAKTAQSIDFEILPDMAYFTQAFQVFATASSLLPVSFTASAAATSWCGCRA